MTTCDLCKKKRHLFEKGKTISSDAFPVFLNRYKMKIFCLECGLSYLSQILEFDEKEIEEWLDWMIK